MLEYKDDEWKECTDSTFVGNFNKIRNICSYYDEESELYYENGVFYDVVTNKIVQESKQENEIQLFTYGDDLDYSIACWQQSLLEDSNFNSGKEWSPTWYEGLSDVEIIARVIYGENTYVAVDQKAIAWVIRNRAKKYGCAPVEVVLEDYQFSAAGVPNDPSYQTIKTQNSGDAGWAGAVYRACLICTTLDEYDWDILNEKPSGMSSQTCYRAWFCYDRFSGNGQMYYDGVAVYDVYIAGYGYVESYDELYNIIDSYSDRNIFFSY